VSRPPTDVVARAESFVRNEAGFAQVTTLDAYGYPVCRSMTAFLADGFSVDLVQRRVHRRLEQLAANPRLLVAWIGSPAPGASNDRPHVFDLGRLPARAVMVRGTAELMDEDWTWRVYARHRAEQLARGQDRAPSRDRDEVTADLVGIRVHPYRVRLEGFGQGAQSHDWRVGRPLDPPPEPDSSPNRGAP
jgi:pyridoxamine 5'-phosphate oxidase-like protein